MNTDNQEADQDLHHLFFSTFIAAAASADEMLIKPEAVKQWMDIGKIFSLVDLRDNESFAEDHIPGAVNITAGEFRSDTRKKLKAGPIVLYCWSDGTSCRVARDVGGERVFVLQDWIAGWRKLGYGTEKGK